MGTCHCGCLSDKQPEKSEEIQNESIKQIEKLDKCTQCECQNLQSIDQSTDIPIVLKANHILPLESSTPNPYHPLIHIQAIFRGHLARKSYFSYNTMQPQAIAEIPSTISTVEARTAFARLSPFKFERPSGDEPVDWKGPTRLLDGSVYVGEWSNKGMPHGKGIMYYIDGGICEGYWKEGKLHDKGRRVSPKGDVYTGSWSNGKMEGQGTMEYASKSIYTGMWANNKQHGLGVETWPDGSRFEGNYKDGLKSGKGKFSWADGTKYDGDFNNDVIEGYGKYIWANRQYEGTWKDSKMHGKGVFTWIDGKVYEGDYVNDVKEGFGILKWPDGKIYEGQWKGGKYHGEGMMCQRGKKRRGIWENGEFKQKLRDN